MLSALIVGHGYAGRRFRRALEYLAEQQSDPAVRIAGVCDRSPEALDGLGVGIARHTDVRAALEAVGPDVVIVTVNEQDHAAVLAQLQSGSPRIVLCEKPLTTSLADTRALAPLFAETALAVNLVERYSPVVDAYRAWAANHPALVPRRVEFFWGKHRIADPRPTMGVLSEVIHPLDLIDHIFGMPDPIVTRIQAMSSDFSRYSPDGLDSADMVLECGGVPVVGHTSFVWPRTMRTINTILASDDGESYVATLDFDNPQWDCDRLHIAQLDLNNGRLRTVIEHRTERSMFPEELAGIFKVQEFCRRALGSFLRGEVDETIVGHPRAVILQEWLDSLERAIGDSGGALRRSVIGRGGALEARPRLSDPVAAVGGDGTAWELVTPG